MTTIGVGFFTTKMGGIVWTAGAIFIVVVLGIFLSREAWDSENMLKQLQSDCDKRGGVMLEHKGWFGTNYSCASRLD